MSLEKNKAITTRIVDEFINRNNPVVAKELFAEDFVNHNPMLGVAPDREGLIQMIAMTHQGFPDYHVIIEDMIAEKDKVVIRMRNRGTGEFSGIPPTNQTMDSCNISIIRFEDGKVKERWNISNQLEMMQQLGLM